MLKKKTSSKRSIPTGERPIDQVADDVNTWWQRSYVFMKKTQVKTWQSALILAFVTGIAVALIWSAQIGWHIFSSADTPIASLNFADSPMNGEVGVDLPVDVVLDTKGSNVVAVRVVVLFNKNNFQYVGYDTTDTIFSVNNTCVYNNKPCEIFENDAANGKVALTLAKPTPGVNTASGEVGTFIFKPLTVVANSTTDIQIQFLSTGNYTDSDVITDDGNGTDILQSVAPLAVTIAAPMCTSFDYSPWGECKIGDTQTRTVTNRVPAGCDPGDVTLSQPCTYIIPVCTSFTYSAWGACQPNNKQTRTIASSLPLGCAGGTPAALEQSCVYNPGNGTTCTSFTYSEWGVCQQNNTQVRTITSSAPNGCTGGTPAALEQSCTYAIPTCTSFTYSDWSVCVDHQQTRTVTGLFPAGCTGGSPVLSQSCDSGSSTKKETKKDRTKPKFTDLPLALTKRRGEIIWWKAKDNKGISYYKYTFNGKTTKTKSAKMVVPITTARGPKVLNVKAYDKAGNSVSRRVAVWVR